MDNEGTSIDRGSPTSFLELPRPILYAVVATVNQQRRSNPGGAALALRSACRVLKQQVDSQMTEARFGGFTSMLGMPVPGLSPHAAQHLAIFPNLQIIHLPPDDASGFELAAALEALPDTAWRAVREVRGRASVPLLRQLLRVCGPQLTRLQLEFGEAFEDEEDAAEISEILRGSFPNGSVGLEAGIDAIMQIVDSSHGPLACVHEVEL